MAANLCASCLKSNPSKRCGGCKITKYCSKECQIKHWKSGHNKQCKKLKKASTKTANERKNVTGIIEIEPMQLRNIPSNVISNIEYYISQTGTKWMIFAAENGIYKYNIITNKYLLIRNHYDSLEKLNLRLFINNNKHKLYIMDMSLKMHTFNLKTECKINNDDVSIENVIHKINEIFITKFLTFQHWNHNIIYLPKYDLFIFLMKHIMDNKHLSMGFYSYHVESRKLSLVHTLSWHKCYKCRDLNYHCNDCLLLDINLKLFYCEFLNKLVIFYDSRLFYANLAEYNLSEKLWHLEWKPIEQKLQHKFLKMAEMDRVLFIFGYIMMVFDECTDWIWFWDLMNNKRYKSNVKYIAFEIGYIWNKNGFGSIHFMDDTEHTQMPLIDVIPNELRSCLKWDELICGLFRDGLNDKTRFISKQLIKIIEQYYPLTITVYVF